MDLRAELSKEAPPPKAPAEKKNGPVGGTPLRPPSPYSSFTPPRPPGTLPPGGQQGQPTAPSMPGGGGAPTGQPGTGNQPNATQPNANQPSANAGANQPGAGNGGGGGGACQTKVIFDCANMRMEVNGQTSPITCGAATGAVPDGRIGAAAPGGGPIAGARTVNMDPQPCHECGIHGFPPHNPQPIRATANTSAGCIRVGPEQLSLLERCQGASFEVKAGAGTARTLRGHGNGRSRGVGAQ